MNKVVRLVVAVIVSALSVAPVYLVLGVVDKEFDNDLLFLGLITAPLFALVGVVLVGLPVHTILLWKGLPRPIHYIVPGFVIPALSVAVWYPFGKDELPSMFLQAVLMGTFGGIVAAVFRRVALGGDSPERSRN